MNITIKGLDMPQSCRKCKFCVDMNDYPFSACFLTDEEIPFETDRLEDCPLIGIVECKDCEYWHEHEWYNTCDKHIGNGFEPYHFCSYGEMRNE